MHLRDRCGAHRHFIEAAIDALQRPPKAQFDLRANGREGHGWQCVLQPQQIVRCLIPDQIGARRQCLPQLDGGRPDRLEGIGIARLFRDSRAYTRQPY